MLRALVSQQKPALRVQEGILMRREVLGFGVIVEKEGKDWIDRR